MILQLSLSRQGAYRTENRDVSGSAQNAGASLYIIADGSSKPGSGELARALTHHMLESFSYASPSIAQCHDKALALMLTSLDKARSTLCTDFPLASTSYLALLVVGHTATAIYAGDCCLGYVGEKHNMIWLSSPHCGPNWRGDLSHAVIANSPARKKLLNCMSYRRPHEPAVQSIPMSQSRTWVLATDGFWAELSAKHQLNAIVQQSLDGYATEDDVTFMLLQM